MIETVLAILGAITVFNAGLITGIFTFWLKYTKTENFKTAHLRAERKENE